MRDNFLLNHKNSFIILISFVLVTLIKLKFFQNGFWYDEWHTFFYSNPNFLLLENFSKLVEKSAPPPLYFVLVSLLHKLLGYSPEVGRFISMAFDALSLLTLYFLIKKNFSSKINFFILFFFLLNYSLILYSIELRFYSFYVFVTLINIYFFFKYLNKKNNLNLIKYFFFSLFALSSNYFLLPILGIQFVYLFFKSRLFVIFIFMFILLFIGINFSHLANINELNSKEIWGTINFSFFIGYFFNIFFGNKILGGLILIFIIFIFFLNFNKIKTDEKLLLLIFFIVTTYLFLIFYSFIFTPVLRPRYFHHLIPLILCVFVKFIYTVEIKQIRNLILSFFTIFHVIVVGFLSPPFEKPDTNKMIKIIKNQDLPIAINNLEFSYINQNNNISQIDKNNYSILYFINHFINLQEFTKSKLIFISKDDIKENNSFLEICENNPSYQTDRSGDHPNCLKNNYIELNFEIVENIRTRDYIVNKYQKKF